MPHVPDRRPELTVLDVETGGLEDKHPIIQIAAVAVYADDLEEVDSFECKLLFDESEADPKALEINHFDRAVWERDGVEAQFACKMFANFLREHATTVLISRRGVPWHAASCMAYNVAFDGRMLKLLYANWKQFMPADFRMRCVMQLAYHVVASWDPQPRDYKLGTLCEFLRIPTPNAHEALSDVRSTIALYRELRKHIIPQRQSAITWSVPAAEVTGPLMAEHRTVEPT